MTMLQHGMVGSSGVDVGDIGHSLRFRAGGSTYAAKTFAAAGNQKTWTLSFWFKPALLDQKSPFFTVFSSAANYAQISSALTGFVDSINSLKFGVTVANSLVVRLETTALFRDPTAWYHVVVQLDTTQATASNRAKMFVNGTQITSFTTAIYPATQNMDVGFFNTAAAHQIGSLATGTYGYYDGYLSRVCFVDGQALTPSSFGYFNTQINEWVSKSQSQVKAVVDAGGTNSFMLDFDNGTSLTTLGYDKSSKGNNWTLNNFSLTAGTTYDWMLDVPGNSYATLNPLIPSAANITNGNLTSGTTASRGTINALLLDSKWEVTAGGSAVTAGVISGTGTTNTTSVTANKTFAFRLTTTGSLDYKNVTDAGAWTSITTGLSGEQYPYSVTQAANWNFGQAPLHSSATYQAAAGGYFFDTTTGYKALCQANLETPAILNPTDHHVEVLVTKASTTQNFTLPWDASAYDTFFEIKRRDAAGSWYQIDGLRGYDKYLVSNSTAAEVTDANVLSVSGTTCTLGSSVANGTYVISATKAGLSSARQTNTDGSITSTVSRNVLSGFSIVTYTGTGANATVGHGLGAVLKMQIVRKCVVGSGATSWTVGHYALPSYNYALFLDTTDAQYADAGSWNNTAPTSSVFSIGTALRTNDSGSTFVAYCYADSAIQKSFSFNTQDAYVDLGFKMGHQLLKRTDATSDWFVWDSTRAPSNVVSAEVYPNLTSSEGSASPRIDMTAYGFKVRATSGTNPNVSGASYIGHAWAAVTGKYSAVR